MLLKGGIKVPKGQVASTAEEAYKVASQLRVGSVIKAQVHAGGRGKGGGIKLARNAYEAREAADSLLGTRLVTPQTSEEGIPVSSVLVEEALDISQELYLGIVVDGSLGGDVVMASVSGGMDVEEVAESTPEKLYKLPIDPMIGFQPFQARRLAYLMGLNSDLIREFTSLMINLHKIFSENDCSLVEINPLIVTSDGRLLAGDAKIGLDDDALFRHPDLLSLNDSEQEEPLESDARKFGISYIRLDGDVGCLVNGAGLAMATMDIIRSAGAGPANFLDVGGSADENKVAEAVKIILSDSSVKTVLVNIFGGILRCDVVARGMILGVEAIPYTNVPIVVRMLGTNSEEGRNILSQSELNVTLVDDMAQAAEAIN
jgi:succinyl-CoA synthetase beta subunit